MAFVLAGCGKDVPEMPETSAAPAHDHAFIKWFYDADNHGYVCDCGAKDAQPHDLDEYGWCATCEFSVVKNDDGSYSIITFDERDNMSGYINYDADGNVLFELVCINEYYEDGNTIAEKITEEITSFQGSVVSIDKMGRKKLAYDVQGYRDGYFANIIVSLPAESIVEFKRNLKLNDNVLRFMFLEVSKKAQTV